MLTLSLLVFVLGALVPQAAGDRDLTVESYLELARPVALAVAPDGTGAALVVRTADLNADRFVDRLYLWRRDRGTGPIGPGFASIRQPRFSQRDSYITFLAGDSLAGDGGGAAPGATAQLWIVDSRGPADPHALTSFAGGVLDQARAPDGSAFVLARESPEATPALFSVSIPHGATRRVWGGVAGIAEIALSPDGKHIAFSTSGFGGDDAVRNLAVLDLETASSRRLTDRAGSESGPAWTADGSAIVFRAPTDPDYPHGQTDLFRIAAEGGRAENLTEAFDRSVLRHVTSGDAVIFTAAVGPRTHVFALRPDGAIRPLSSGASSYRGLAARSETVFAIGGPASEPPELWRISGSRPERLTDLNAPTRDWRLGKQEVISWPAPDGLTIEAVLVYPAGYEEGRRYPLLVHPAGGPGARATDELLQSAAYQLFADRGYLVLAPNFRGSLGYGENFARLRREDLAGGDLTDMLAGVAQLVSRGIADSTRVGIYGSGYAGWLTAWTLTRTPRFAAAVADLGTSGIVFPEGDEPPGSIRRQLRDGLDEGARQVQTPLLIATDADPQASADAGYARVLFASLSDLGKQVELVELGGDLTRGPRGRADLFLRQLRWMDRHLVSGGVATAEFYLPGESVPGPEGWSLRTTAVEPVAGYAAVQPDSGRYLEVELAFQPEPSRGQQRAVPGFQLDPATGVQLVDPEGEARPLVGTVTELFGEQTLVLGMPTAFVVPEAQRGSAPAVTLRLAFQIPEGAAVYRLLVEGFLPIRVWAPASNRAAREGS